MSCTERASSTSGSVIILLESFKRLISAASGVKRNIPGPCGKAMAANGNRGWGDVRRDASDVGGEGAAGRAQDRGAELTGDRATARPGGLDGQPRAAAQRPAEGRLPAGPRRGLLP